MGITSLSLVRHPPPFISYPEGQLKLRKASTSLLSPPCIKFADREYLAGALDSMLDLCTCGVSEPPFSKDALSSESSSSDLPLSLKLLLFLDPSLVSELPHGLYVIFELNPCYATMLSFSVRFFGMYTKY
ncbi:hypothetical protein Tco_0986235 [Tanacetum coccineum]|uniref:Uncharacterized protein n=1 Tax=Tanacetum coccineum TaxID=301880 RepID=A0ABQ5FG54_9ASTR